MKLEDLSREDLLEVATQLSAGKSIEDISKDLIPQIIKDLTDAIHNLMCRHTHGIAGDCAYYQETSFEDKDHKKWVDIIEELLKTYSYNDVQANLGILASVVQAVGRTIPRKSDKDPKLAWTLVKMAADEYLSTQNPQVQVKIL